MMVNFQNMKVKWILFDCFNTLIDDFDADGDESGMKPIAHIPVEYGFYKTASDFHHSYLEWRASYWADGRHEEVLLVDRLQMVLRSSGLAPNDSKLIDRVVAKMMDVFLQSFPSTVRLSPGVKDVLESLRGRVKMGAVSNFFLPGYPELMLRRNGLDGYFDFILDSAQMGSKKPGTMIYEKAVGLAGLKLENANEVLFVGDSLSNDVVAPESLGMKAIHFDRSMERGGSATPSQYSTMSDWTQFIATVEGMDLKI